MLMLVYYGYVLIHSQLREQRNPLFEKNNWTVLKSVRPLQHYFRRPAVNFHHRPVNDGTTGDL